MCYASSINPEEYESFEFGKNILHKIIQLNKLGECSASFLTSSKLSNLLEKQDSFGVTPFRLAARRGTTREIPHFLLNQVSDRELLSTRNGLNLLEETWRNKPDNIGISHFNDLMRNYPLWGHRLGLLADLWRDRDPEHPKQIADSYKSIMTHAYKKREADVKRSFGLIV